MNFEDVESLKIRIERSLPSDVIVALRQANYTLTLSAASLARFHPVVVDPKLADELAEQELLEEMVSYRKKTTGVDHIVFVFPKGNTRHGPRIKLAINPPDSLNPRAETTSSTFDGEVVDGVVPSWLLKQVRRFLELNRDALTDFWEYRISGDDLQERLRSIS